MCLFARGKTVVGARAVGELDRFAERERGGDVGFVDLGGDGHAGDEAELVCADVDVRRIALEAALIGRGDAVTGEQVDALIDGRTAGEERHRTGEAAVLL